MPGTESKDIKENSPLNSGIDSLQQLVVNQLYFKIKHHLPVPFLDASLSSRLQRLVFAYEYFFYKVEGSVGGFTPAQALQNSGLLPWLDSRAKEVAIYHESSEERGVVCEEAIEKIAHHIVVFPPTLEEKDNKDETDLPLPPVFNQPTFLARFAIPAERLEKCRCIENRLNITPSQVNALTSIDAGTLISFLENLMRQYSLTLHTMLEHVIAVNLLTVFPHFYALAQQHGDVDNVKLFLIACTNGHQPTVAFLWNNASVTQQPLIEANNFYAFQWACRNGHQPTVAFLWEKASATQQPLMIEATNFYAFQWAYLNGHQPTVAFLWEKASIKQKLLMIEANNFLAFRWVCENGHQPTVAFLWEKASTTQQTLMIEAYNFEAFRWACKSGHQPTVAFLWEKASATQQTLMIEAYDFEAFRRACENGYQPTVVFLWSKAPPPMKAQLRRFASAYPHLLPLLINTPVIPQEQKEEEARGLGLNDNLDSLDYQPPHLREKDTNSNSGEETTFSQLPLRTPTIDKSKSCFGFLTRGVSTLFSCCNKPSDPDEESAIPLQDASHSNLNY